MPDDFIDVLSFLYSYLKSYTKYKNIIGHVMSNS